MYIKSCSCSDIVTSMTNTNFISEDSVIVVPNNIISAHQCNGLVLETRITETDSETDPRRFVCCKKASEVGTLDVNDVVKTVYLFEGRYYKITYFDNDKQEYLRIKCKIMYISFDESCINNGYIQVKAYLTDNDIEREVSAGTVYINIACLVDAEDITKESNPVKGDEIKVMLLGISATKVRSLIINLKLINDKTSEAIKEVSMIIGNKYTATYVDRHNINNLYTITGTLVGMKEIPVSDMQHNTNTNTGVVREDCGCIIYPKFNKYYDKENNCNCCEDIERIEFGNNIEFEIDKFLSLPTKLIQDVELTFKTSEDWEEDQYTKFYLSQLRNICEYCGQEDPANTYISCKTNYDDIVVTTKNVRNLFLKVGSYDSWEEADIYPQDLIAYYPHNERPLYYHIVEYADPLVEEGNYTLFAEFTDDTRSILNFKYEPTYLATISRIYKMIEKFNSWAIKNFHKDCDYTKPLFELSLDQENNALNFNINYYSLNKHKFTKELFSLLNPKFIDDFFVKVLQDTLGNNVVVLGNNNLIYYNNYFDKDMIKFINYDVISKFITWALEKTQIGDTNTYLLNNTNILSFNKLILRDFDDDDNVELTVNLTVTFEEDEDKENFEKNIKAIDNIISFNTEIGEELGYQEDKLKEKEVLVATIHTGNVLKNYLNKVNTDRRIAVDKFNVYKFLEIFSNLDVMEDAIIDGEDYSMVYNDLLKIVQRDAKFICHLLSNLDSALLNIKDDKYSKIIGDENTFNMEKIDEDTPAYDIKGFYKLITAFENFFHEDVLASKMSNYNKDLENYSHNNLYNFKANWKLGTVFKSMTIPFTLNYDLYTKEENA